MRIFIFSFLKTISKKISPSKFNIKILNNNLIIFPEKIIFFLENFSENFSLWHALLENSVQFFRIENHTNFRYSRLLCHTCSYENKEELKLNRKSKNGLSKTVISDKILQMNIYKQLYKKIDHHRIAITLTVFTITLHWKCFRLTCFMSKYLFTIMSFPLYYCSSLYY